MKLKITKFDGPLKLTNYILIYYLGGSCTKTGQIHVAMGPKRVHIVFHLLNKKNILAYVILSKILIYLKFTYNSK